MDQLRQILRVMWQQRFWLLTSFGTIVAAICWMLASKGIDAEFAKKKSEIDGKVSAMNSLQSAQVHGNPEVNAAELAQTKIIRNDVRKVWAMLYERQREEVLQWPDVLGKEFVNYIESKKFGEALRREHRETYLNYIKDRFDGLLEIVKAKKLFDPNAIQSGMPGAEFAPGAAGYAGRGAEGALPGMFPEDEDDYLVQWADQTKLQAKLTFPAIPSAMEIWVTQEDLWVYQTLLRAIAATNDAKGATRPDNTAIRAIVTLDVGREAAEAGRATGNVLLPAGAADGSLGGEYPMGGPESGMSREFDGYETERSLDGGEDPAAAATALLASRYVDAAGQPVTDPAGAEGQQFRRLPVHMTLLMDQRWLPTLLIEFANAPLPVEVSQVRINPELSGVGFEAALSAGAGAGSGRGGFGSGRMGGEFGGGMGGYGGSRMGGEFGGGGYGAGATVDLTSLKSPGIETIVIQGVVYIYSEPSDSILLLPGEDGADEAEAAPSDVAVNP
ncbi:MAG: hypothetical protein KF847_05650 [Pirellulales bacterium]|nr:hypothetical protein [Pirellulales bacterium]